MSSPHLPNFAEYGQMIPLRSWAVQDCTCRICVYLFIFFFMKAGTKNLLFLHRMFQSRKLLKSPVADKITSYELRPYSFSGFKPNKLELTSGQTEVKNDQLLYHKHLLQPENRLPILTHSTSIWMPLPISPFFSASVPVIIIKKKINDTFTNPNNQYYLLFCIIGLYNNNPKLF